MTWNPLEAYGWTAPLRAFWQNVLRSKVIPYSATWLTILYFLTVMILNLGTEEQKSWIPRYGFAVVVIGEASILIFVFGWSALKGQVSELERQRLSEEVRGDRERQYALSARLIGMSFDRFVSKCRLQPDGSMEQFHEVGARAVESHLDGIEHRSRAAYPQDGERRISIPEFSAAPPPGLNVRRKDVFESAGVLWWAVLIDPGLKPGASLKYTYTQYFPKASFAMTRLELEENNLPFEYYFHRISHPTRQLDLRVEFPSEYIPQRLTFDTWYGLSRIRHMEEYARLVNMGERCWTKGTDQGLTYARLFVPFPLLSLTYAIRWVPSDQSG